MSEQPTELRSVVVRSAGRCALMLAFAGALVGVAAWVWAMMRVDTFMRTNALITIMIAAIGSTICLAGAMHFLDVPMIGFKPPWWVRCVLKINKRVILAAQFVTMGMAIAAGYALIFGFGLPGMPK